MNESFILYTSYYSIIEGLSDEQLGQLVRALFIYVRDGKQIKLDPVVCMAFSFIKDNLDRNNEKYQKKCERNRENIRKRWKKNIEKDTTVEADTTVYGRIPSYTTAYEKKSRIPYDNDNDNDNDNEDKVSKDTMNPNNNINSKLSNESYTKSQNDFVTSEPERSSSVDRIDWNAIKDYWNEQHDKTNSSMRRLTLMSEKRKTMIRARLRQVGGDMSVIYKVIDTAMASDFMNGNNSREWTANFDWIFGNENNFAKTLEGYDDKPARAPRQQIQPSQPQEPSLGERYKQLQHQDKRVKDEELVARYIGMIETLDKNPKSLCRGALLNAYESGELKRLGIDWKPS